MATATLTAERPVKAMRLAVGIELRPSGLYRAFGGRDPIGTYATREEAEAARAAWLATAPGQPVGASGVRGVYRDDGRWRATVPGTDKQHLGYFKTVEAAREARELCAAIGFEAYRKRREEQRRAALAAARAAKPPGRRRRNAAPRRPPKGDVLRRGLSAAKAAPVLDALYATPPAAKAEFVASLGGDDAKPARPKVPPDLSPLLSTGAPVSWSLLSPAEACRLIRAAVDAGRGRPLMGDTVSALAVYAGAADESGEDDE